MFIIGVVFIILFVIRELTMKAPMLNLEVLKSPTYTLTTYKHGSNDEFIRRYDFITIISSKFTWFLSIRFWFTIITRIIINGVLGPVAGKLLDTIGLKPLALFGIAVMTYGTYELTKLNMDTSYLHIMSIYVIRSIGMAFVMMPLITAAINALPPRLISHGNAFLNTMRQLAGSIGTAILVTVMTTQSTNHLNAFATELDKTNPVIQDHVREMAAQYGVNKVHYKLS